MDWTGIKVSTAPAIEPVTVSELKTHLRLDGTTYDTMLAGYISACRDAVEKHTGRTLINTVLELYYDEFPSNNGELILIRPPVQSVSSIIYVDEDGVSQTLSSSLYRTDLVSLYPRITPAYDESWPDTQAVSNAVKITYTAGYGAAAANVPAALKECIKSLCADLFEHPESNVELNLQESRVYKFLLNAYTIPGIA